MGTVKVEELMVISKPGPSNVSSSLRTKTKKTKIPKSHDFFTYVFEKELLVYLWAYSF